MIQVRTLRIDNDLVEIQLQIKQPLQLHGRRMIAFSKTTSYSQDFHFKSLSGANQRAEFLDSQQSCDG